MKKNKLYILITLLTAAAIFSSAAVCNQCAINTLDTKEKVGEETSLLGTTASQTISDTTAIANETTVSVPTETEIETTTTEENMELKYINTQYGFSFLLPESWNGYSIIISKWEGNPPGSDAVIEYGPIISIRNPGWTQENPYQDIPIMVFTISQWDLLQQEVFHIGAAPVGPTELGQNAEYIFALPARYNYAFPTGFEEVEKILESNPLETF